MTEEERRVQAWINMQVEVMKKHMDSESLRGWDYQAAVIAGTENHPGEWPDG